MENASNEGLTKEALEKARYFLINNPEEAMKLIKSSPELREMLSGLNSNSEAQKTDANSQDGNSLSGNKLSHAIPGVPMMYNWDDKQNGFSNYLLLSILAFLIQFIITLICIFFYK